MKKSSTCRVLVSMGPGGVGKTTTSAATAYSLAKLGHRVVVMTIDPSPRLKSLLGLKIKGQTVPVPWESVEGRLFAHILDPAAIFDEFIKKAAQHTEAATRLTQNRLYQELVGSLSGSQEFTSLEKLRELVGSGDFDWVLVDTPPAEQALEFLTAPDRLMNLFDEGIASWFRIPLQGQGLLARIVRTGTQQVLKALEFLTGGEFVRELADFFISLSGWQGRLRDRLMDTKKILYSDRCEFQIVTTAEKSRLLQIAELRAGLLASGLKVDRLLVNRGYPQWYPLGLKELENGGADLWPSFLKNWFLERQKKQDLLEKNISDLKTLWKENLVILPEWIDEPHPMELDAFLAPHLKNGGSQ